MNATTTELFDLAILRVLDANRTRYGLTIAATAHLIAQFGFPGADQEIIKDRIEVLVGKELVEEVSKLIGAANRAFRLTDAGLQFVNDHP